MVTFWPKRVQARARWTFLQAAWSQQTATASIKVDQIKKHCHSTRGKQRDTESERVKLTDLAKGNWRLNVRTTVEKFASSGSACLLRRKVLTRVAA
ncbi:hypothetical protein T4D_5 [Trichinella pseudospiralis]|uniref:Uncharacterized protein n=1 Tax=Trichinella pseudospiralis TaxID=6337 RepID=A0A0V1FZX8_TRIPS|nr:hypothetical protein T4D_5 [Trichinella pseudospiralis]